MKKINNFKEEDIYCIIEIPKNSRVKYEFNEEFGMIEYDRTLQTAMDYPGNYGFIPDTMGGDDDPLDVILYNEYPIYPNTLIKIRIIGALEMIDEGKEDYKILADPIQNKKINERRNNEKTKQRSDERGNDKTTSPFGKSFLRPGGMRA